MSNEPYSPYGLPLPQSNLDAGQSAPVTAPQIFHAPDTVPTHVMPTAAPQQPAPQPQPPQQPAAIMPLPPHMRPDGDIASMPVIAAGNEDDDSQLDEVWINKTKEIVDKTRNDPFLQSQELSKIKAGYLKSRYNKDIKIIEDPR